jgi:hypothetical protein
VDGQADRPPRKAAFVPAPVPTPATPSAIPEEAPPSPEASRTPRAATPPPIIQPPAAQPPAARTTAHDFASRAASTQPAVSPSFAEHSTADANTELPKIANPFDDPGPNSPFPSVPLPIHGQFEYAPHPGSSRRRRKTARAFWTARIRTRPLIVWAAVLALVCFGANALVRYKIKRNAQRFASESASTTPANPSDGSTPTSAPPAGNSEPSTAANPSGEANSADGSLKDQSASSPSMAATRTAQNDSLTASPAATSKPPKVGISAPRDKSTLDGRDNGAYVATASPGARSTESTAAPSSAATPRSWAAPAPNPASAASTANSAAPAPIVTNSSNNVPVQSAPVVVAQTRPTPPSAPAQAASANATSNPVQPSNANTGANRVPAKTQTPPPNSQQSTSASNPGANTVATNTTPSRSQSQIYNANAPVQHSAILGSISSVHSSGIFDSNDSASSAPARGNTNVAAARPASNNSIVPTDTPQEREIQIEAPKGFKGSYVDLPGEHMVRSAVGTIHIRRSVRVPGERVPGQRWLWRGRMSVALGDVINRVDPAVAQVSGSAGSLTVQATIDKDGYVTDFKPLYGNFAMLPAVSRAVRSWHYEPTYLDSKRAETQAQIEFDLHPTAAANRATHP